LRSELHSQLQPASISFSGYVGFATVGASLWWFMLSQGGPRASYYHVSNWMECEKDPAMFEDVDCQLLHSRRSNTMALSVLVVIEMLNAFNR
jgi:P-type Ca2+ transporter type 2A